MDVNGLLIIHVFCYSSNSDFRYEMKLAEYVNKYEPLWNNMGDLSEARPVPTFAVVYKVKSRE